MNDNNRTSVTSSSSDPSEGSEYVPSDSCPSPPRETRREVCVCNLSVDFLLKQDRWVGNPQNLYEPVSHENFHEAEKNGYFESLLGRKCAEVGEVSDDGDIKENGVQLEYSAEYQLVQCLACARNGKYTAFKMYQSVLRYEEAEGGYKPRLAWFIDLKEQRCCNLWRIDGNGEAEDGAVFGIWGDDGPHSRLTFRVATKRKSPLWIRCLQNTKAEQLEQFLRSNGVYVASQNEAESALRQQLEAFDKPQWDMYERRKFAVDITPSTGGLLAVCAACYNARAGEPRCEGTFQVRKVVLRPFKHKEYQILAYRIGGQTPNERFIFLNNTLRFLKTNGTYTDLALRLVRNGQQFDSPVTTQCGGPHMLDSRSHTAPKRTYPAADSVYQPPQKRVNSAGFTPINGDIRTPELLGNTKTLHFGGAVGSKNGPGQAGHSGGHSISRGTEEKITLPRRITTIAPGASYLSVKSRDPVHHQKPKTGITWDLVEKERRARGKLQSIRAEKQNRLLELNRLREEEKTEIANLDAHIGRVRQQLLADVTNAA